MNLKKISFFDTLNIMGMLLLIAVTFYPLYYMGIVSISSGLAVQRGDVFLYPVELSFKAYSVVLDDPAILRSYGNTLLYTALGVTVNLIMTTLCAYPLSRTYLYGKSLFAFFVVFTMFFDGGLIPRYMVVNSLGMVNTIWAILIPTAINVFNMLLMRTFFEQIPEVLNESATIDGAGEGRILLQIILPLCMPVMATMFIFYAVSHWNSFFPALIYLNDKTMFPLQILVRNIVIQGELSSQITEMGSNEGTSLMAQNVKYAVVFIAILPILAIYPFVQKYFVQGAMLGAVKG
ncbi:carbohydrate ABC transporter permease [Paenibacillus radicis (ex Xue et al. 2023)]|uniref:Carbohydrate ABC transporter permease n=1 Tax=Paenibacillus radicis (ex Xue et al. 2023) TaxID=2972489 RepID=A0ABT1YLR3_9BACL|nr:carbohydrate ABC transporter permease [Paenibacillus radicis (ex Xue et al. 2023)]MCR8634129.1 carbohydrate ABC transporter permease [Paenibacillus radicis (ex Xue et al. 2023)]